jgi:hypothetical protein
MKDKLSATIEKYGRIKSKKKALKILVQTGICTKTGRLTKNYRNS